MDLALACPSLAPRLPDLSCSVPSSTWTWIPLAWIAFTSLPATSRVPGLDREPATATSSKVHHQRATPPRKTLSRRRPPIACDHIPYRRPSASSIGRRASAQGERFAILLNRPPCPTAPSSPKLQIPTRHFAWVEFTPRSLIISPTVTTSATCEGLRSASI